MPPPRKTIARGLIVVLAVLAGIAITTVHVHHSSDSALPFSEVFPSLKDVVSMVRLSHLVYTFRWDEDSTCADFYPSAENHTQDLECEWYQHEYTLGTQVWIVSNHKEKYIAVVFAGTDDARTLFEDTNILTKPFGNNSTVRLRDNNASAAARVHAGFNNAVFTHGIWESVDTKTRGLLQRYPSYQLWTTGHSLGGANAVLTATALALVHPDRNILSVSFGCPQTGNRDWWEYFSEHGAKNLGIWRVVLSWDLIARLPEFFRHAGHTIQVEDTDDVKAYYEHYGDKDRGYAGVPTGWYAKSHAWLPYALNYHRMKKYTEYIEEIEPEKWVKHFAPTHSKLVDDDDDVPSNDDPYWIMPDDSPLDETTHVEPWSDLVEANTQTSRYLR